MHRLNVIDDDNEILRENVNTRVEQDLAKDNELDQVVNSESLNMVGNKRSRPPLEWMNDYYVYNSEVSCFSTDMEIGDPFDPTSYSEAMRSQESDLWMEAMKDEIDSIEKNEVWELCDLPKDRKSVGCKWILKRKYKAMGLLINLRPV